MLRLLVIILLLGFSGLAEAIGEYEIVFEVTERKEIDRVTRIVGIDKVDGLTVYAVATDPELEELLALGYKVTFVEKDRSITRGMATTIAELTASWDLYPTYEVYTAFMNQLATSYPTLCQLENIGQTVNGRDLLFLKITDNVGVQEDEPEVMLESTMHGDETTGFVLLLRLADRLLSKYGDTDAEGIRITNIVNNVELWIMPDMNPDGTYAGGNSTVSGARRSNGNYVDLNRNFPDFIGGAHPDGNSYQPETQAMMDFCALHSFVLSANYHGGAEVFNYPWDTTSVRHPDDDWFYQFSVDVVDTIHANSPAGYMTDNFSGTPGVSNGYDWYSIQGGRQDWMTYYMKGREITVEISSTKNPASSTLPDYWTYNRDGFYQYIEESLKGIRGIVTDTNNQPLAATINVVDRAEDPAEPVITDPDVGDYHRMLLPGTYTIQCSAPGYQPQTASNVTVPAVGAATVNFQLNGTFVRFETKAVESACRSSKANNDGILDPGELASTRVTLMNDGVQDATGVSAILTTTTPGITIINDTAFFPDVTAGNTADSLDPHFTFRVSDLATCGEVINFDLTIFTDQGSFSDSFTQEVGLVTGGTVEIYSDSFETDTGWTLETEGEWERGSPSGLGGLSYGNPDPNSAYSGSSVLGNDLSGTGSNSGDYESYVSNSRATSPAIDCSGFTDVQLSFYRWLNVEDDSWDTATIEVSNNGISWNRVWVNTTSITETAWSLQTYDISGTADDQQAVYVRFGIDTDSSYQYSGWNIDDLTLSGDGPTDCVMDPCNQVQVPGLSPLGFVVLLMLVVPFLLRKRT